MALSAGVPLSGRSPAQSRQKPIEIGLLLAILAALLYVGIATALDFRKYAVFLIGGDTADYTQELWLTIHGQLLAKTSVLTTVNQLRGDHVTPILLLLALPFRYLPDPRTLLVIQVLAVASGGILVYLIARLYKCAQLAAVSLVAFYFLYPVVHYATINDFHTDPLAVPTILGALYAFDTRRWRMLAVCLLLTLTIKEQMVLVVFGLGVYWWAFRGAPRIGQLAIGAAVLYALAVLLPWYLLTKNEFSHDYGGYFGQVVQAWHGIPGTASGIGTRLDRVADVLSRPFRLQNVIWALLPSGFLFLLDASALVLLLPLAGLYAGDPMINYYFYHHYIITVPFILYGAIRAVSRPLLLRWAPLIALLLVAWALALGYSYSSAPLNLMHLIHQPSLLMTTDRNRAQAAMVRAIPADAPVDADYPLAAHLAKRTYLFQLQDARAAAHAQYILLDLHTDQVDPPGWMVGMDLQTLASMRRSGGFKILRSVPEYGLFTYVNCRRFPDTPGCGGQAVR
ncbi:MAG TPA: DUF2079 domain-containing protein [Chloroflexota bacterium]|nr:DUF2079 domain-containing protein [Chloroflexota bacterium]